MHVSRFDLLRLCPNANGVILNGIERFAPEMFPRYGIDTHLRFCHMIAQLAHESAHMRTTVEYASGAAYEGRKDLGNNQPGDGVRYKGRGLIQLTGRSNYRRVGAALGLPLEDYPEMAADFPAALETGLVYWRDRRLNQYADADDVEMVTRAINGGVNGLADRMRYLVLAKQIWPPEMFARPPIEPDIPDDPNPPPFAAPETTQPANPGGFFHAFAAAIRSLFR